MEESQLENLAYSMSSEEFQFKTLKRNIIDHGKSCYIKGYKQHETDFERFLLHHGYFSIDELSHIRDEFNTFQTDIPELTLETVERYINTNGDILVFKDGRYVKQTHVELTDIQKDIFKYYTELTNETPILHIQKPRVKGVSTILKIIAQIEALGGKNVLYAGFDMCTDRMRKIKNLTYYRLHSYSDVFRYNLLIGKHYDLIIIDEMIAFKMPYEVHDRCVTSLTENGRMIIVGTPPHCNNSNYRELKRYFKRPYSSKLTDSILYIIEPSEEDRERAGKYPDCKNETLGEFFD